MKKCLKITALCSCFVLFLFIMLISNIPKTYANSSIGNIGGSSFNSDIYYNPYSAFAYGFYYYDGVDEEIIPTLTFSGPRSFSILSNSGGDIISPNQDVNLSQQTVRYYFDGYINNMDGVNTPGIVKPDVYYSQDPGYFFAAYWDKLFVDQDGMYVNENTYYFYCDELLPEVTIEFDYFNYDTGQISSYFEQLENVQPMTPIPVFSYLMLNQETEWGYFVAMDYTIVIQFSPSVESNLHIVQTMFNNRTTIANLQKYGITSVYNEGIMNADPDFNDLDLGEWLLNNINSFLDFELVPGFTLSSLLALLVGIPLLLWLFKMLFGG